MATVFLSNANSFLPSFPSTYSSSPLLYSQNQITGRQQNVCKAADGQFLISRRGLAATTTLLFNASSAFKLELDANAAILEADDDEELLEKVKKDRKKRIERQGVIKSSTQETAYLQDLVYKLSRVGQAIENNDLSAASSVLGPSKDTEWIQKVNSAFNKLSTSSEEKKEVDTFNSSLATLISTVSQKDTESSKVAFVALASTFEKWSKLSGLGEQLKGL